MAEIYLAEARGIEGFAKPVVLKCILPQYANSESFVRLFLNEARVTASLDHPNIASVYDIGEVEGTYFFAMEYLHGEDVGHMLRELTTRGQRLPLEHALTIGAGVAAGLHTAHEKRGADGRALGIVHRDVSPSNVVVTFDGGVKLVDFGVAKLTAETELTHTASLRGKLSYMSPEQCHNDPLDRRSDVFSLGVLLYELTTLCRLFRADSEAGTLRLVMETQVPPPSTRVADYPPDLEAVLLRALARRREDRYASARDLQLALEDVARKHGLVTSAASLGEWMLGFFGDRPAAWMTPEPQARHEDADGDPGNRGKTPILLRSPPLEPLPADADPPAASRTPAPLPRGRLGKWLPMATAVAATALIVGFVMRRPPAPATQPAAPPAPVAPLPKVIPVVAPQIAVPSPAAARTPARPPRGARKPASPLDRFRTAFARKQNDLLACFARFGEPAAAPSLWLRFHADTAGRVQSAELTPEDVAQTALGRCLIEVARTTQFGPQDSAVTFRIPVSVRRIGTPPAR